MPDVVYQMTNTQLSAIIRREIKAAMKEVYSENRSKAAKTHCSVSEAKSIMSLSKTKIYELIKLGELDVRMVGRKKLVTLESIETYLNQ